MSLTLLFPISFRILCNPNHVTIFVIPILKIIWYNIVYRSQDTSISIVAGYGLDGWGLIPGRRKIFLFSTESRPALRPTQLGYWASFPGGEMAGVCS
jgi:hypothetical protein